MSDNYEKVRYHNAKAADIHDRLNRI